ncbi:MAG TPA: hypothetical protein VN612_17100 [Acidobacteriaceae bacterium]|nr:hypothetical protein [Acidobacteriaceae bacterium]
MQKPSHRLEAFSFAFFSAIAFLAAILITVRRGSLHTHNPRLIYAFSHLPAAFVAIAVFSLAFALRAPFASRMRLRSRSTVFLVSAIAVLYCVFWLPVWLAGGLVQDDWWLLAAASIRKIVFSHPGLSWYALDTVDGNFRPLGTVLYFSWIYHWFGVAARAFTFGPFVVTFFAALVAFAVVRQLGYSRLTAAVASSLFISRGMLYIVVAWAAALGDSLAIAFCGLSALFILKANRARGVLAALLHVVAWICFIIAALSKQSAFAMPLIVALLLYLRPGEAHPSQTRLARAKAAASGLAVYAISSALIFFHAKGLLHQLSPYPIGLSVRTVIQPFAYATWYFAIVEFPDRFGKANLLPPLLGIAIVAAVLWRLRRTAAYAAGPRDLGFLVLAAFSAILLFALLGTRSAAYYGCMAGFWISILIAVVLSHALETGGAHRHLAAFIVCALLVSGFAEVRLEQTGLFPSGGYIWGTFGMHAERHTEDWVERNLASPPLPGIVVIEGCRFPDPYTSMVLVDAPAVPRILVYNPDSDAYAVNDRLGLRPADDLASLSDPRSYHWDIPIDHTSALSLLSAGNVRHLSCPAHGLP